MRMMSSRNKLAQEYLEQRREQEAREAAYRRKSSHPGGHCTCAAPRNSGRAYHGFYSCLVCGKLGPTKNRL